MEKIPCTAGGYAKLEAELKQRKSIDRPAIIQAIAEARAHGDLSENAEYSAAKEKQSFNEGRIKELEAVVSRADVIDLKALTGDTIKFGATVKVVDDDTEEETTYQIVGEYEADIKLKQISITAPMARALIGKKKGDAVEVRTPGGTKSYEILDIKYK
jgi:transcription elongation factor GreA